MTSRLPGPAVGIKNSRKGVGIREASHNTAEHVPLEKDRMDRVHVRGQNCCATIISSVNNSEQVTFIPAA